MTNQDSNRESAELLNRFDQTLACPAPQRNLDRGLRRKSMLQILGRLLKTGMSTITLELVTSYREVRWRIRPILGSIMISISRTRWTIVTTFSTSSRRRTSKTTRAKVSPRNRWLFLSSRAVSKVLKSDTVAKSKISMLKIPIRNSMRSRKKKSISGPKNANKCTKPYLDLENMGRNRDHCQTWKESRWVSRRVECKGLMTKSTPNLCNQKFHQGHNFIKIKCKAKPNKKTIIWTVWPRIEMSRQTRWTLWIRLPRHKSVSSKTLKSFTRARRRHLMMCSRILTNKWSCSIQITSKRKSSWSGIKTQTTRHFRLAPWEEETILRPKPILSLITRAQVPSTPSDHHRPRTCTSPFSPPKGVPLFIPQVRSRRWWSLDPNQPKIELSLFRGIRLDRRVVTWTPRWDRKLATQSQICNSYWRKMTILMVSPWKATRTFKTHKARKGSAKDWWVPRFVTIGTSWQMCTRASSTIRASRSVESHTIRRIFCKLVRGRSRARWIGSLVTTIQNWGQP